MPPCGTGGDIHYPEQVIGHLAIAKDNLARVLADKVLAGNFTEEDALDYAERFLWWNSAEFYKLGIGE